ncbi:peptidoglycan recognition protein family protein, partial [Patescibacteria group bacterium]|nr:peptidoglycan recognition protein family protein [Patescibacteria group bacterium]
MKGQKTTNFFAIGAVTVIVIAFLSCQAWAETKSSVKHNQVLDSKIVLDNGIYKSPVFETDTEFNLVGLAWRGSDEVEFSVRFNDGDKWSQWYSSEADDFIIKEDWHYNVEPVITEDSNKIQYSLQSNGPVEAVKIHLINTTKKNSLPEWNFLKFLFGQAVAESELNIISRSDWKADEEWRLDGEGEKIWPVEHAWPAKFVIHHTAGSDGGDDPGATIRGIYYWHGVVLGWGDIGYNYLIDQQGNIYEGRYGGDGTIGAHAYRSKSCAKQRFGSEELEADFNKGTIGISVLGDYENSSLALSKKVKNALAELIGHKAAEFEIIPKGESFLIDDTYPNIVGHRDLDCTDCPGIKLYNKLEDIRNLAQEVYLSSGGSPEEIVKATYIDQSEKTIEINAGETREFWVEFRNDGNIIWRNYAPTTLQVVAKSKAPGFYLSGAEPD